MGNISQWVEQRAEQLRNPDSQEATFKKMTLRVDLDYFHKLDYIANQTLQSKTGVAEQLLAVVIQEAFDAVRANEFLSSQQVEFKGVDPVNEAEWAHVLAGVKEGA